MDDELSQAVSNSGASERGLLRSPVLHNFKGPDPGALCARPGQVKAFVTGWSQQDGTGRREVRLGIKVAANSDRMCEDSLIDVLGGIDINAPHQLDKLARPSQIVSAGLVDRLADEMKGHCV